MSDGPQRIHVGCSGWSYRTWKPGFYPESVAPDGFLSFYAARFDTVELNTLKYRLPPAEQFERWRDGVPDGFTFAPKLDLGGRSDPLRTLERVALLGDRLGPVRVLAEGPRDDGLFASLLETAAALGARLAFDLRHPSWDTLDGVVRVGDREAVPFSYVRLREPPYSDEELRQAAAGLQPGAYVYLRHEDAPTAPVYAARLLALIAAAPPA